MPRQLVTFIYLRYQKKFNPNKKVLKEYFKDNKDALQLINGNNSKEE